MASKRRLRLRDRAGWVSRFARQLAGFAAAGVPLRRALEVMAGAQTGPGRVLLGEIAAALRQGRPLADALEDRPEVFPPLACGLIRAGEAAGRLDLVCSRLADALDRRRALVRRLTQAMLYPLAVLGAAAVVVLVLVGFVLPRFRTVYGQMFGREPLPPLTAALLDAAAVVPPALPWLAGLAAALALAAALLARSPAGRAWLEGLRWALPGWGPAARALAAARFCRSLGLLLGAGAGVLRALELSARAGGSPRLEARLRRATAAVAAGSAFAPAFAEHAALPAEALAFVATGEETGRLPDLLQQAADALEADAEHRLAVLTALVEPAAVVVLTLTVGLVMAALFLPLTDLVQRLGTGL